MDLKNLGLLKQLVMERNIAAHKLIASDDTIRELSKKNVEYTQTIRRIDKEILTWYHKTSKE